MPRLFGVGDGPRALCVPCKHSTGGATAPAQESSLCAGLQEHAGRGQGLTLGVIFCSPPFFEIALSLSLEPLKSSSLPPQQYWGMHSEDQTEASCCPVSLFFACSPGHSRGTCRDTDFRSHRGAYPGSIQVSSAPSVYLHTQVTILGL